MPERKLSFSPISASTQILILEILLVLLWLKFSSSLIKKIIEFVSDKYITFHELDQRHLIQLQRTETGIEDAGAPILGSYPISRYCNTHGYIGKPYP